MRRRMALMSSALLAAVPAFAVADVATAPEPASPAGMVRFVKDADSTYDTVTERPSAATRERIRRSFFRAVVYVPYWEARSRWYGDGWVYRDLYAIYRGSRIEREHPEWILRDRSGRRLSIPFGCNGRTCPLWAGDITDPAFRRWWITDARRELSRGSYRGIFVDDVNLDRRVSDARERPVTPIDSKGRAIGQQAWREAIADFATEVRRALPDIEIVHNVIWFAGGEAREDNAAVKRAWTAADYVFLERGVTDGGITGGDGRFSLRSFLGYVDAVHRAGPGVVLDAIGSTPADGYALAAYFLVNDGRDVLAAAARSSAAVALNDAGGLGNPAGPRYGWRGLLRRDFARGTVLVNEPGAPRRTVSLDGRTLDGRSVAAVTLGPAAGVVLRR